MNKLLIGFAAGTLLGLAVGYFIGSKHPLPARETEGDENDRGYIQMPDDPHSEEVRKKFLRDDGKPPIEELAKKLAESEKEVKSDA